MLQFLLSLSYAVASCFRYGGIKIDTVELSVQTAPFAERKGCACLCLLVNLAHGALAERSVHVAARELHCHSHVVRSVPRRRYLDDVGVGRDAGNATGEDSGASQNTIRNIVEYHTLRL